MNQVIHPSFSALDKCSSEPVFHSPLSLPTSSAGAMNARPNLSLPEAIIMPCFCPPTVTSRRHRPCLTHTFCHPCPMLTPSFRRPRPLVTSTFCPPPPCAPTSAFAWPHFSPSLPAIGPDYVAAVASLNIQENATDVCKKRKKSSCTVTSRTEWQGSTISVRFESICICKIKFSLIPFAAR
jgi:hypothetical protein